MVTNLTVATHLIGTPWLPDLRGAILVLEDVGEAPYVVDRMLTQWRTAGQLQGVAGVGLGRFQWIPEDVLPGTSEWRRCWQERLGDLGIPVWPPARGPLTAEPRPASRAGRWAQLDGNQGVPDAARDPIP